MEETMMMMISSPENSQDHTDCPSWKLYENPFYYSQNHEQQRQRRCQNNNHLHRIHLPVSSSKIAASFWDLTIFRPIMESELDLARAQISELKAQIEYERKVRKKAESVSKRLAKEMMEERRGREAMERICEKLAREISSQKTEIGKIKREIEDERKMLRMAEVLREERVQMKLGEAKILYEQKWLELEGSKRITTENFSGENLEIGCNESNGNGVSFSGKLSKLLVGEKSGRTENDNGLNLGDKTGSNSIGLMQRKASPESENHHIKRGIKGFVEFPKVVRAIGSKSRQWGTKLECQKAQLRILLKQKSPITSSTLIMS